MKVIIMVIIIITATIAMLLTEIKTITMMIIE